MSADAAFLLSDLIRVREDKSWDDAERLLDEALRKAADEAVSPWELLAKRGHPHYSLPVWDNGAFRIYFGPLASEARELSRPTATETARALCQKLGYL